METESKKDHPIHFLNFYVTGTELKKLRELGDANGIDLSLGPMFKDVLFLDDKGGFSFEHGKKSANGSPEYSLGLTSGSVHGENVIRVLGFGEDGRKTYEAAVKESDKSPLVDLANDKLNYLRGLISAKLST